MNLLLLEAHEVSPDGRCELRDRRAEHVRSVLRAEIGQSLRAGIVDGPLGTARVVAVDAERVAFDVRCAEPPPVRDDVMLLAYPRPKVLLRMLAHAATMGFARIVLFRSWRVDKTWMHSRACRPELQREQLLQGLEQGGRTRLPQVVRFDRFRPMVEDELERLALPTLRFVAHPAASATPTSRLALPRRRPFALAIGPDGGFVPYEVERLAERGFAPIHCGPHALRTETALATLWGQLDLLRERAPS